MLLLPIAAGSFTMGSGAEAGRDDERPAHRVWVDAFELGACQVTNAEYDLFLNATGNPPPPLRSDSLFNDADKPVVSVSWFEATAYCQWLSAADGRAYRLPSEAEWERAARGGVEGRLYPWGDGPPESRPDYSARWLRGPEPVGHSSPNAYGLFDLCENVHEWCSDWYAADFYGVSPERNPRGPEGGTRRVSRGGSWRHHIKVSRCAARSSIPPALQYTDYGFRVACSPSSSG